MIELRCPFCETANAVRDGVPAADVRCAECAAALDGEQRVRYAVADNPAMGGTHVHRDLRIGVERGLLTPDAWLSEEGGPWFRGYERADLFPAGLRTVVPRTAARRSIASDVPAMPSPLRAVRSRARRGVEVPGSVQTMAVLNRILAALSFLVLLPALAFFTSFLGGTGMLLALLYFLVPGYVLILLDRGLRRGSRAAQVIQLILAGALGLFLIAVIADGATGAVVLIGALVVALPFLLLLNEEARAFFR